VGDQPFKLMPYWQKERGNCFSIVINALQAKENTKFKQFLNSTNNLFLFLALQTPLKINPKNEKYYASTYCTSADLFIKHESPGLEACR
jgi:hypothetical protein